MLFLINSASVLRGFFQCISHSNFKILQLTPKAKENTNEISVLQKCIWRKNIQLLLHQSFKKLKTFQVLLIKSELLFLIIAKRTWLPVLAV